MDATFELTADGAVTYGYVVSEGDDDQEVGALPVALRVRDAAGNEADVYTTSPSTAPAIDANAPVITGIWAHPSAGHLMIGDELRVNVTVDDGAEDEGMVGVLSDASTSYSSASVGSTINGVSAGEFIEWGKGEYSFTYTVTEGDADRDVGDLPVRLIMQDPAGNEVV